MQPEVPGRLAPMSRLGLVVSMVAALIVLSACDGYIEQVRIADDESVEFDARATIACLDELTADIWGDSPCDTIDAVARGESPDVLPFELGLDTDRTSIVAAGEQDRRRIDVTWEGAVEEFGSVLIEAARVDRIGETTVELVVTPGRSPMEDFLARPEAFERLADAGWPPAEFRVVAPGVITEHNADEINGRTVSWFFDRDRPEVFRVRWTGEGPPTRYWWWIVGGSVLVAVLFMMATLEGSGGRNDDRG